VDGKCIASACRNDRTAGISALRVTVVSDPFRVASLAIPYEKPSHLTVVALIMNLLERYLLGPPIWMADEVHTFVFTWLANIQQERGDSVYVCTRQVKLIECIIIKWIFTRQPFATAPFVLLCLGIFSPTWCVEIEVKGFWIIPTAVSSGEDHCTLGGGGQLHYPTCATQAHHERGL